MAREAYGNLRLELERAADMVPLDRYQHYKNGAIYRVTGYLILEATREVAIEYVNVEEPTVKWGRSLAEWIKPVESDGIEIERFSRLD